MLRKSAYAFLVDVGKFGLSVNTAVIFVGLNLPRAYFLIAKCAAVRCRIEGNLALRRQALLDRRVAY